MVVSFYKTTDDRRVLSKTLTDQTDLTCELYDTCNVLKPSLLIEYNATIFTMNYCYIPLFGRYYFVDNITSDAGERIVIECSVDVLQTYNSSIENLNVTVTRNEFSEESLLADPLMTFTAKRRVEVYPFNNTPFNIRTADDGTKNFVLVVGGGYGS